MKFGALVPLVLLSASSLQAAVTTSFNVDLSPSTQTFASAAAASLTLNYTIDGAGNVDLDAVALTSSGGDASPARYNQIDNASAGTVAPAALYNTSFALTFSGSSNPILNYTSYDNAGTGAVLVVPGGNIALESGEFVAFTVSGTATSVAGFSLNLVDFSYDLRIANGQSSFGVQDTSGTVIQQLIPNTSLSGTIDGSGISLAAGETMTFRPITGNAGGAGLSGFTFEVIPEPSTVLLGGLGLLGLLRRRRV